jgi:peptidoglycan-associated lipoprotein
MSRVFWLAAVVAGALTFGPVTRAQDKERRFAVDLGVTYSLERGKIATVDCGCVWKQGGSLDAASTFFHGLGAAVTLTGDRNVNIGSGVSLSEVSFMAGPRYTFETRRWTDRYMGSMHAASIFGQALFGVAHGLDGAFPSSSGLMTTASASSMEFGGGLNIALAKGFGARAFELDYVRTTLPNGGNNIQNNVRLSFGFTYRIHRLW